MSHFLWIEDFAGNSLTFATKAVFGGLVKTQQLTENGKAVKQLLRENGVFLELTFVDGLQFIRNPKKLLSVDYVILDIDLAIESELDTDGNQCLPKILQDYYGYEPQENEVVEQESFEQAKEQLTPVAGYQLYVELVMELGFPKEHILFCSSHAAEQKAIQAVFKQAKIELPLLLAKDEETTQVQAWVRERRENHYSLLRRGILNVLDHLETQNIPLTPPFADEDDPIDVPTFLTGLAYLLKYTLKEPTQKEQQSLFLTLCDSLTKPFERFSKELLYRGLYRGKTTEISVDKEYIIPAYFVRNWIAHGVMNHPQTPLSAQDTAFLFMLVTKSLFDYSCFEVFQSLYPTSSVTDKALTHKLSDLHEYYSYPKECDIFELIRVKGEKKLNPNWQQEPFVAHIYASFLFNCLKSGVFKQPELEQYKKTRTNLHKDEQGYYFNLSYRLEIKDDLFEKLKPIAYHQLRQLEEQIPLK